MLKMRSIWFQFADMPGFSGQREASRLIYEHLDKRVWRPRLLRVPALEREGNRALALIRYAGRLSISWLRGLWMAIERSPVLHLNLGQTEAALLRDGLPLRLAFGLRRRRRVVISLHGSNFMEWPANGALARQFVRVLKYARLVTVLGEKQRARLVALGISGDLVRVVPNTCAAEMLDEGSVLLKHAQAEPLRVLFLSSLIDTKGYPQYLEALELLARQEGPRIEAVLCGPLTASQFGERFKTDIEASAWIEAITARINRSERVSVRWIPGARGADKWDLYRAAHVFVFPSQYRVEAQPIVLLEAMAHGCALITTKVGEIPTILSSAETCFLETGDADEVAADIAKLALDLDYRRRIAIAAWRRFKTEFSLQAYTERWDSILKELSNE